jgi:hypothetical protein
MTLWMQMLSTREQQNDADLSMNSQVAQPTNHAAPVLNILRNRERHHEPLQAVKIKEPAGKLVRN